MGNPYQRQKPIYWDWRFSSQRPDFWPSAAIQEDSWKLLTNKELNRTELYNIGTDWSEQNDVSAENPEKVKVLMDKINTFEASLPKNPPADTFSKERE